MNLPEREIAKIIALYASDVYVYPEWVTSRAFRNRDHHVCLNPLAKYVRVDVEIDHMLAENPADWAINRVCVPYGPTPELYYHLARNTNKRAIAIVDATIADHDGASNVRALFGRVLSPMYKIDEMLSANPERIEFLREHPEYINPTYLMWNPAAKDLIEERKIPIVYEALGSNPADWAVDLLFKFDLEREVEAERVRISQNTNRRIVDFLIAHPRLIDWKDFSANPTAIDYLSAHPDQVRESIYANPAVMELVPPPGLVDLLMSM